MTDYEQERKSSRARVYKITSVSLVLLVVLVIAGMIFLPQYHVYQQRKAGQAALAHATFSREVKVAEAKATMESASFLAQADTIRAHGIARSNQIIGGSLTDQYIHWYYIDNIEKNPQATIYIPTENGFPLLEANRLNHGN